MDEQPSVYGILCRHGPESASNTFYYLRIFLIESEIQSAVLGSSQVVKEYTSIPINKLGEITNKIDSFNFKKEERKGEQVPESDLVKAIDQILV